MYVLLYKLHKYYTLNHHLVLRGVMYCGHIVFTHFAEIPAPIQDEIFTLSTFEPIMLNACLALMVMLRIIAVAECQLTITMLCLQAGIVPIILPQLKVELEHLNLHENG